MSRFSVLADLTRGRPLLFARVPWIATAVVCGMTKSRLIALLTCLVFFGLQAMNLRVSVAFTDEGAYVEVGRLMLNGLVPYVDFKFWHMPLMPAAIGMALKISGSLYWLRLLYLALGITAAHLLFELLSRRTGDGIAALVALFFYLSFDYMHRYDFRYFALRQSANILLIAYLGAAHFLKPQQCRSVLLAFLSACIGLTFLPAAVCLAALSIALVIETAGKDQQRALFRDFAIAATVMGAALWLWAMIPGAVEQAVLAQAGRPGEPRLERIAQMLGSRENRLLFGVGAAGLALELIVPSARSRALAMALLLMFIVNVLVPTNYFPHYTSGAAIAFATGACLLVLRIRKSWGEIGWRRWGANVAVGGLVFLQAWFGLPSVLKEWRENRHPDFYAFAAIVHRQPEPLLALPAILAAEADREMVPELTPYYIHAPMPVRLPGDPLFESAAAKACTIVLNDYLSKRISSTLNERWLSNYDIVERNGWGWILLTRNPHCPR